MKFARLIAVLLAAWLAHPAAAEDIRVFAEGAYTATELAVFVYADINSGALCSYGVKLTYNPERLTAAQATHNPSTWFLGASGGAAYPYPPPMVNPVASPAEIVFAGAKLDAAYPKAGVTGKRVLLGKAVFSRPEASLPIAYPEAYFKVGLSLGKKDPYANFVGTAGGVKDGFVVFGPVVIRRRGDADGDGKVTNADLGAVRNLILAGKFNCYADADGDGKLTNADMGTIRNIILGKN